MKKYSEDVSGLKEIFERREKLIQKINALQQGVESKWVYYIRWSRETRNFRKRDLRAQ